MPKPNPKDKNQKQNIIGKALKDIIPSSYPHVQDQKKSNTHLKAKKFIPPKTFQPLYIPNGPKMKPI